MRTFDVYGSVNQFHAPITVHTHTTAKNTTKHKQNNQQGAYSILDGIRLTQYISVFNQLTQKPKQNCNMARYSRLVAAMLSQTSQ
jgi:hypothetical protein